MTEWKKDPFFTKNEASELFIIETKLFIWFACDQSCGAVYTTKCSVLSSQRWFSRHSFTGRVQARVGH